MESIAFCKIVNEPSFLFVAGGHAEDSIVVSNKTKSCNIYTLADQKLVKSWSLRHGVTITSPVQWDKKQQKFMCVANYKDVHTWDIATNDWEKSKKKHSTLPIHELMVVDSEEAVILYSSGAIGPLSGLKQPPSPGPVTGTDAILWAQAAQLAGRVTVMYIAGNEGNMTLYVYSQTDDSWECTESKISPPKVGVSLSTCDCTVSESSADIILLWSGGQLTTVSVGVGTITQGSLSHTVHGCQGEVAMVTLNDFHIAVAGVQKDGKYGICIIDMKYGLQKSFQPFAERPQCKPKLVHVGDRLFVPCHTTLYVYQYQCEPSTLASLLGQTGAGEHTDTHTVPAHLHWEPNIKPQKEHVTKNPDKLLEKFQKAINKSSDYQQFKKAFSSLVLDLKKAENHHWLMSNHMTQLVQRILGEKKFWANQELEQLIANNFIPISVLPALFECLAGRSEVSLVYRALMSLNNVPERCLCQALTFFLQVNDEKIPRFITSDAGNGVDTEDLDNKMDSEQNVERIDENVDDSDENDVSDNEESDEHEPEIDGEGDEGTGEQDSIVVADTKYKRWRAKYPIKKNRTYLVYP
ncbi:nucleolar protein 11-like [Mya arenaria]|uniref:nucleolar protein 11-like n=1 Tax=Mya arenaria TaxID=6604 RepID=UPI0022E76F85|nr:nucleolar protein 11-like [Mya arenaria]